MHRIGWGDEEEEKRAVEEENRAVEEEENRAVEETGKE